MRERREIPRVEPSVRIRRGRPGPKVLRHGPVSAALESARGRPVARALLSVRVEASQFDAEPAAAARAARGSGFACVRSCS